MCMRDTTLAVRAAATDYISQSPLHPLCVWGETAARGAPLDDS